MEIKEFDSGLLSEILPSYYGRLFPGRLMYRWLSYGNPDFFAHREFSFTLSGDVYIRYQSFTNDVDFVAELKKKRPEKIDIGAVFNQKPKTRDIMADFIPLQKEFVLDIDLTDYDDVRTCCQGAKVCQKCWKFIGIAVQIMDESLRKDFGFKHLLWVFSGRRGVHCWVCDETAINMDSNARGAVMDYLTVIKGGENQTKKVKLVNPPDRLHPFIARAVNIIDEKFEEICRDDQNLLEIGDKNFDILPPDMKEAVMREPERFNAVMEYYEKHKKEKKSFKSLMIELKLQLCFPRLDVNVSKGLNHLLKSPFCVHPKTGNICVPFDPKKVFDFDPENVPGMTQVLDEINCFDKTQQTPADSSETPLPLATADYKKTALAPCMEIFETFVRKLEKARKLKSKGGEGKSSKNLDTMDQF